MQQSSQIVLNKYIDEAREILSSSLLVPAETISPDQEISSIGEIDSLSFELIMLELERKTGRTIDPVAVLEVKTVRDIADILSKSRQ